ncbi:hypothetical protein BC830DRAFT_1102930 [Chytriomyces sp. MP71]|nr:hypothetical protein BC830DRAFT_1102930 [Chytriomyces sp. MP71]
MTRADRVAPDSYKKSPSRFILFLFFQFLSVRAQQIASRAKPSAPYEMLRTAPGSRPGRIRNTRPGCRQRRGQGNRRDTVLCWLAGTLPRMPSAGRTGSIGFLYRRDTVRVELGCGRERREGRGTDRLARFAHSARMGAARTASDRT